MKVITLTILEQLIILHDEQDDDTIYDLLDRERKTERESSYYDIFRRAISFDSLIGKIYHAMHILAVYSVTILDDTTEGWPEISAAEYKRKTKYSG